MTRFERISIKSAKLRISECDVRWDRLGPPVAVGNVSARTQDLEPHMACKHLSWDATDWMTDCQARAFVHTPAR